MRATQARQIFAVTLVSCGSYWTGVFSQDYVPLTANPPVTAAANISKSDDVPIDLGVLTGKIDNDLIYRLFLAGGQALTTRTDILDAKQISAQLKQQRNPAAIRIPNTLRDPPGTKTASTEVQDRPRDSNLSFVELVLRRCVTLDAIRGCFAQ